MSPDDTKPAAAPYRSKLFNGALEARRPLTQTDDPEDADAHIQESLDLLAVLLGSAHMGLIATSPMRDKRTGIEYIGIVAIHPDDKDDALLTGHGRKIPIALLLTKDRINHMEPVNPRQKGV